jgi:hypothetical protein
MASDETGDEAGEERGIKRLEREIRALQRKQFHQRERLLLLQQGMNRLAEAMADHPGLDYPEELKPITFLEGARKDVLFLSFGGVRMGAGIPPAEFHASLKGRDVPGYFIKDFRQSWYQEGLLGLSSDVAGTEEVLRALIARHAPKHLVTLGISSGGYAAILFGALLGADRVLAFSPQTEVTEEVAKLYAGFDTPLPKQFVRQAGASALETVLRERERLPEIGVVYSADNAIDMRSAEALRGIKGIGLVPMAGVDVHPVTVALKRNGQLSDILERLISF